ncbi:hypothetical protein HO447_00405 [Streptococcus suis]|nr:hypothetical protein [Streptococcus suis]
MAVNQTKSELKITSDAVATKVSKTDFDATNQRLTTAETTIRTQAGQIEQRLTSTQVNQAILADKQIKDTRNDNQTPQWYWTNYPKQTVEEFKGSAVIGLTGESTFAILTTNVQWQDSTGGKVKQTAKTDRATFERYGSGTTWDPWVKIANSSDLANYTTKTEFQTVKETTSLYERILGKSEGDIQTNASRLVMTDNAFVTEVSRVASNSELLARASNGLSITTNPTFDINTNGIGIYNNYRNGTVTVTKQSNVGSSQPNGQPHRIMISHTGTASPGLGGFYSSPWQYRANTEYAVDFVAMLPVGYSLNLANNYLGTGGEKKWLTPNIGTGKWERYVGYYKLGTGFQNYPLAYIYVTGPLPNATNPLTWYVQSFDILDLSNSGSQALSTRVSQLDGSWAVQNLTNSGTVLNQLNLNKDGSVKIDGKLVQITGTTYIEDGVISSAKIGSLDAGKITTGTLDAERIAVNSIDGSKMVFDQAFFTGLTANEAYLEQLFAKDAFITQVQAVTLSANKISGGILSATNDAMQMDLNNANISFNTNAAINFNSANNALVRRRGTHTAFLHFNDVASSADANAGGVYAGLGVTSSGDGINSQSSGRFSGIRIFRSAIGYNHNPTLDHVELYGDTIYLKDAFDESRGYVFKTFKTVNQTIDMNLYINAIKAIAHCLNHLRSNNWDWKLPNLRNAISGLMDSYINKTDFYNKLQV